MATYKWNSPHAWLEHWLGELVEEGNITHLHHVAREMAYKLDADQIQDLFQDAMDDDGYYRTCYYGTDECDSDLWICETCGENYCQYHFHETSKGRNVECVACERDRRELEEEEE